MPNTYYENGYALLIGIAYEHWAAKVAPIYGTLRDISALGTHFADPAKAAYRPAHIISVTEADATAENILLKLDEFAALANSDPDASVLVYYSGHGETDGTNNFLVPYDFDLERWRENRTFDPKKVVLSKTFTQKLDAIQAQKCLVVLDCCHAASMPTDRDLKGTSTDFLNYESAQQGITRDLSSGKGRVILTSCEAHEKSLDLGTNGLFTKTLLECLNGMENLKKDGWVRLIDMIDYVPKTVKNTAATKYNHTQNPMFKSIENLNSEDFILCAYNIVQAKGLAGNAIAQPVNPILQKQYNIQQLNDLIDTDIDKAFDHLDDIFGMKGAYKTLSTEWYNRPNNFEENTYKSKLKRFVKVNLP